MSRILGAVLCSIGGLALGAIFYHEKSVRAKALAELVHALRLMRSELSARHTPIPRLTEIAAEAARGEVRIFFASLSKRMNYIGEKSFYEIWQDTLDEKLNVLSENERGELASLGCVLGRTSAELQVQAIAGTEKYLSECLGELEEKLPELRRTSLGLCSMAGLLTAVILI